MRRCEEHLRLWFVSNRGFDSSGGRGRLRSCVKSVPTRATTTSNAVKPCVLLTSVRTTKLSFPWGNEQESQEPVRAATDVNLGATTRCNSRMGYRRTVDTRSAQCRWRLPELRAPGKVMVHRGRREAQRRPRGSWRNLLHVDSRTTTTTPRFEVEPVSTAANFLLKYLLSGLNASDNFCEIFDVLSVGEGKCCWYL